MSDNFDLKKYLVENKATTNSRMLSENETGKFYAPTYLKQKYGEATAKKIEAEIDELDANAWDRFTAMESAEEVEDYIVDIKDMLGLTETKKKHSKMMKENAGTEIIEVQGGSRGEIEDVKLITTDKSFEQFCIERGEEILQDLLSGRSSNDDPEDAEAAEYRADYAEEFSVGEPVFNASKSLCDIAEGEESGYVYIDASKIDSETKKMLLDDSTDTGKIYNILDDLY